MENHGNHGFGLIDVPHVLPLFAVPHTTLMSLVLLFYCLQFCAQKNPILAPQALGLLQKNRQRHQKGGEMDLWCNNDCPEKSTQIS